MNPITKHPDDCVCGRCAKAERDEIALRFAVAMSANASDEFSSRPWTSIMTLAFQAADAYVAARDGAK